MTETEAKKLGGTWLVGSAASQEVAIVVRVNIYVVEYKSFLKTRGGPIADIIWMPQYATGQYIENSDNIDAYWAPYTPKEQDYRQAFKACFNTDI
jgi:hypothetical protein